MTVICLTAKHSQIALSNRARANTTYRTFGLQRKVPLEKKSETQEKERDREERTHHERKHHWNPANYNRRVFHETARTASNETS